MRQINLVIFTQNISAYISLGKNCVKMAFQYFFLRWIKFRNCNGEKEMRQWLLNNSLQFKKKNIWKVINRTMIFPSVLDETISASVRRPTSIRNHVNHLNIKKIASLFHCCYCHTKKICVWQKRKKGKNFVKSASLFCQMDSS